MLNTSSMDLYLMRKTMQKLCSLLIVLAMFPLLLLAAAPGDSTAQGVDPAQQAADVAAQAAADREALSRKLSAESFLRDARGEANPVRVTPPRAGASMARATRYALPKVVGSENGRLDVELVLDYAEFYIGNDRVRLRTYNENLVGPVLRVKAGETLNITLRNKLPVEAESDHPPLNSHHNWNTTNLHFHGLHVAPQGTRELESDNVLLRLKPILGSNGSVQKYAVKIPEDHPAGTFWYHPHVHGSTTAQVSSGAAGALIIERDDDVTNLDNNPAIKAAAEDILVLQQIPYLMTNNNGVGDIENVGLNSNAMFDSRSWGSLGRYITVNGQKIPTINIAPGEVRRFRFVHTGQRHAINLQVEKAPAPAGGVGPEKLELFEIAVDSLPTGDITSKSSLELYPGYRSDVLIRAPFDSSGEYDLVDLNAPAGTGADGSPELLRLVARIVISGTPKPMDFPRAADLAKYRLDDLTAPTDPTIQYAFYGIVNETVRVEDKNVTVSRYYVSRKNLKPGKVPEGKEFDPTDVRLLKKGKIQQWVVGSRNGGFKVVHPFHIHINPFLIQKVQDEAGSDVTTVEIGKPTWRDTLAIKQGYTYTLITEYKRFAGDFVDHCHILDHEDHGMMERVTIVDPAAPPPTRAAFIESPAKVPVADPAKPTVLLFVKGSSCPHCLSQLDEVGKSLGKSLANVVIVSAAGSEDLGEFPKGPFALVADPKHELFREYGAFKDEPLHATIVVNAAGKTVLKEVGNTPFTDLSAIRKALTR
jgi:FtsP/CotA-like multicopper oxidase with cupredoxin domain/peroxiredoxin